MTMERRLEDSYEHINQHLDDKKELKDMCSRCERYRGKRHNYDECLDMPCFKFFLGYLYLKWGTTWE